MTYLSKIFDFIIRLLPRIATIEPNETGVFLRFGRYKRTLPPGMYFCYPVVDLVRKLDVTPQVINLPDQSVTSKDNTSYAVSGAVEYSIKDARKALLCVQNFDASLQNLAMGTIFEFINSRPASECADGKMLNEAVSKAVRAGVHRWGLDVTSVYLHELSPCKVYRLMSHDNPSVAVLGE